MEGYLHWIAIALQWARAQSRFKELWFVGIAVGGAFLLYTLSDPTPLQHPWRYIFEGFWEKLVAIFAVTQMTSSVARIGVETGMLNATSPVVPVTSSK